MSDQTPCFEQWWKSSPFGTINTGGYSPKQVARVVWAHRGTEIDAAHAADAQIIATLRAEVERSGDALAIERGLVTIYRNDVERHAQTIATLQDENARLKAELEQATRAIQENALTAMQISRAAAEQVATLKADADRREREAHRALVAIVDAVYALRSDFGMKYPALSEALFAAQVHLTQRQEQPKASTDRCR